MIDLLCLIEGMQQIFTISISKNDHVNDLRKMIFNFKCKALAPDYLALVLLNVRVLLIVVQFPLLTDTSAILDQHGS